jgi:hypothetical protein
LEVGMVAPCRGRGHFFGRGYDLCALLGRYRVATSSQAPNV